MVAGRRWRRWRDEVVKRDGFKAPARARKSTVKVVRRGLELKSVCPMGRLRDQEAEEWKGNASGGACLQRRWKARS